jgi:ATP-dependent Clp protease, protease subunit
MANKTIIIDGYIGAFGFSKQYVRNELAGNSKNPVTVKISSMGGSVDHAISIFDQFREHGNVTAELSAFVASSATLLSLGAKSVRMNENSFYLIHKPMYWVDSWGTMNEDDIDNLVAQLEKQKQQLAKITIQMAKMYVVKTGKSLEEIITLMKQETWLSADEAKEWGFVDEIIQPEEAVSYLENELLVALITANGFPTPPGIPATPPVQGSSPQVSPVVDEDSLFERLWNRISGRQKDNPKNQNQNTLMKQFQKVNAVLGVESLEAADGYVSLNEQQLESLDNALQLNEQLTSERDTAHENLTRALASFDAIDTTVAEAETTEGKVAAIRTLLAAQPGSRAEGNRDNQDPEAGKPVEANWEAINNLPHNREVDQYA